MKQCPGLLTMLTELVSTPSVSSTQSGWDQSNLPVIELLEGWLTQLGFQVEVLPVPGYPGKANLIATLGSGPGGLVLSGHTDTVPYNSELWHSDPFKLTEKNNRLYGLGSCDMKGFIAIAIEAAKDFLDSPLQQPLIILATADEESSMSGARALAALGKPKARYAVIGEPTGLKPVYMHKGFMVEAVRIEGKAGHSSDPSLGASALDAMHAVLSELIMFRTEMKQNYRNSAFNITEPTLNLGCVHGGDNPNRICGRCDLEYDLRPLPGMDLDNLREEVSSRLAPLANQFGVHIKTESLQAGFPAFANSKMSDLVRTAEKLTGFEAETVAFGTEAPFIQSLGMDTIIMGPGCIDQAHQPDEFLALDQIKPTVAILQQMIRQYCL